MAQKLNPPLLVAVDTNVALDLADQCEAVVDSINTIPVIATPCEVVRRFFR